MPDLLSLSSGPTPRLAPRAAAIALILLAAAPASFAGLTAYSDQAAWEADLFTRGFGVSAESFDGIEIASLNPSDGSLNLVAFDFSTSVVSLSVAGGEDAGGGAFFTEGGFHGQLFPDDPNGHDAYVHDFGLPIVAFGQNYRDPGSGRGIRLQTAEGTIDVFDDGGFSGFDNGFFGFIADAPVQSVQVIASDGASAGEFYEALDLSVAFASSQNSSQGDYNLDGTVDIADYTVWRDSLGATGLAPGSLGDGDLDREVTTGDYAVWLSNFGRGVGDGSVPTPVSVPEPGTLALLAVVMLSRASRR